MLRGRGGGSAARQHLAGVAAVEADDDGACLDRLDPAGHIAHGHALGGGGVRVRVVRHQVAFLALADAPDHAVAGEEDEHHLGPASGLRQPV